MSEEITLTQEELYTQAWAEPMIRVAARYQITGRGLATVCGQPGVQGVLGTNGPQCSQDAASGPSLPPASRSGSIQGRCGNTRNDGVRTTRAPLCRNPLP